MATDLVWSKIGLQLKFDVSAQASPRVAQTYPLPDIAVQSVQLLGLALEVIAETGLTGIRVTSLGSIPGTAKAKYSLIHTSVQNGVSATDEISLTSRSINLLLTHPLSSATHSFALKRVDAGQTVTWPSVSIITPSDPTQANIAAAKAAAAGAELVAAKAQSAANAANDALDQIASDSVLSAVEKSAVLTDYNAIVNEQAGIDANATKFSITDEKTTYDASITALKAYLATLTAPVAWNSLGGNTTIVGDDFRGAFAAVYSARQYLLNAITAKAKALADAAQTAAATAQTTATTAQTTATTAATAAATAQTTATAAGTAAATAAIPTVVGDGVTTQFLFVSSPVTRTDWQGTQTLYPTARTNLLLYSQAFENSVWNTGNMTVSANGDTAPDGTVTADKLTATGSGSSNPFAFQTVTLAPGTYTLSGWIKGYGAAIGKTVGVWSWQSGTGTETGAGFTGSALTGVWQRYSQTFVVLTGGTFMMRFDFSKANSAVGEQASVWGFQLEAGSSPTSYIPTTSAAVTVTDYTVSAGVATLTTAPLVGAVIRGLATNASASATTAQTGVSQLNSVDCLTNADKIALVQSWASELATQGTSSTVGSLDYQAAQAGVSSAAYDAAVTALSAGLIAAGAPSTWASTWPDGTTLISTGIASSLKAWWTAIATTRAALQNAIAQVGITAGAMALAAAPKLVSTIAAVTPPASYSYSDGNMVMDVATGYVYTCSSNAWVQASIPTSTIVGYLSAGCIGTSQLAALAVTAAKLSASAVTADKIAANAVTAAKLSASAVTADKIAANAVTAAKLATNVALVSQVISSTGFISGGAGSTTLGVSGGATGAATGWAFYGSPVATMCNNGWPGSSGSTGWTTPSVLMEIGTAVSIAGYEVGSLALSRLVNGGYVGWFTAGTYTWICPPNVTQVEVLLLAGGGGGYGNSSGGGGGGGGGVRARVGVVPGQSYTIVVGAAGGLGMAGGTSSFKLTADGTASVYATGGQAGQGNLGGAGGGGKVGDRTLGNTSQATAGLAVMGILSSIMAGGGGGNWDGSTAYAGGSCQGIAGGAVSGNRGGGGASCQGVGGTYGGALGLGGGGGAGQTGYVGAAYLYF